MTIRPADIAKRLRISTNALRHYEEWGIVPQVDRASNGYRIYTEEHLAYFECIRAMRLGFGMELTVEAMRLMVQKKFDEAMWTVNGAQAGLNRKKLMAEKTVQALETVELDQMDIRKIKRGQTIGEVSKETSIPASAIRHWEKMGLLDISRDKESGYRTFEPEQFRKILMIGTLRSAAWPLDIVKQVIRELDDNNVEQARSIAREALQSLNDAIRRQIRGVYYLHRLLEISEPREWDWV